MSECFSSRSSLWEGEGRLRPHLLDLYEDSVTGKKGPTPRTAAWLPHPAFIPLPLVTAPCFFLWGNHPLYIVRTQPRGGLAKKDRLHLPCHSDCFRNRPVIHAEPMGVGLRTSTGNIGNEVFFFSPGKLGSCW